MNTAMLNKYWENKGQAIGKIDNNKLNTYWANKKPKKQRIVIVAPPEPEPVPEPVQTPQEIHANYISQQLAQILGEPNSSSLHQECKRKADIYFDVQIKNKRRFISDAFHNASAKVKKWLRKKNNKIQYLQPKRTYNRLSKVAIPATQQKYKSQHKLPADELLLQHAIKYGVRGFVGCSNKDIF